MTQTIITPEPIVSSKGPLIRELVRPRQRKPRLLPEEERRKLFQPIDERLHAEFLRDEDKLHRAYQRALDFQAIQDQQLHLLVGFRSLKELLDRRYQKKPEISYSTGYRCRDLALLPPDWIDEAEGRLDIQDAVLIASQTARAGKRQQELPLAEWIMRLLWEAGVDGCQGASLKRAAAAVSAEVQARLRDQAPLDEEELRELIEASQVETPEQKVEALLDGFARTMKRFLKQGGDLREALEGVDESLRNKVLAELRVYSGGVRGTLDLLDRRDPPRDAGGPGNPDEPPPEDQGPESLRMRPGDTGGANLSPEGGSTAEKSQNETRDQGKNEDDGEDDDDLDDDEIDEHDDDVDDGQEYAPVPVEQQQPVRATPPPARQRPNWSDPIYADLPPDKLALLQSAWSHADAAAAKYQSMMADQNPPAPFGLDDICCTDEPTPQAGLLGHTLDGRSVGANLYHPFAMGVFGPPKVGKSWFAGVLIELCSMQVPGANELKAPYCVISLHYFPSPNYESEMHQAVFPARSPEQLELLDQHGLQPQGHADQLVLTVSEHVAQMRERHIHSQVHGLKFPFCELSNQSLRIGMGLDQKESPQYAKEVSRMLRKVLSRGCRTWRKFRKRVEAFDFTEDVRRRVLQRLDMMEQWIDDNRSIRGLIKPGRHIIIDICSEWVTEEEAMMLFALATEVLVISAGNSEETGRTPLLVVYDEAHVFAGWKIVQKQMDMLLRQRRHLLTSTLFLSQDPESVPGEFLPLMDAIGVGQHSSEDWRRYFAKHVDAFGALTVKDYATLGKGQLWWWSKSWLSQTPLPGEEEDEHDEEAPGHNRDTCEICRELWEERVKAGEIDPDEGEDDEEQDEDDDNVDVLDARSVVILEVRPRVTCHGGETTTAEPQQEQAEEEE